MNRVVITGLGMVSPLGINLSESWSNLLQMKSGIIRVQSRNPDYPNVNMGLIPESFDAKSHQVEYCPSNLNAYTMSAVAEALNMSQLQVTDSDEIVSIWLNQGINIGVMNSSMTKLTDIISTATTKGFNKITPFTMLHVLSNIPTANVSIKYKIKGPSSTASTACATGASAIGDSYRKIQHGQVKAMIAGGVEDSFNLAAIYSAMRMQAMSTKQYDEPSQSSRPFDEGRSGFILSEGCGIMILEELQSAKARGADIIAEIVGYGEASDGYHLTRPQEHGEGGSRAMNKALKEAGISDVDIINCHATSTPAGDLSEARAIGNSKAILIANKSQLGHTFGAAGAIESIFTVMALRDQIIPGTLNLMSPIIRDNQFVREPTKKSIRTAMKNAFGFGGVNVSLVFRV